MTVRETPRVETLFESEATEVLATIKRILNDIFATLGVRRPVELQRLLGIDSTLSWQLFKTVDERRALTAGALMPARVSIEKFARNAEKNGVRPEQIAALNLAYESFEKLVERHAGDRATFNTLMTGIAGLTDEWRAADLQHRRNMFRGQSHVMGVQAQTRLSCLIIGHNQSGDQTGFEVANITGSRNIRTLRQLDRINVHNARSQSANQEHNNVLERRPIDLPGEGYLLQDFSTNSLSQLEIETGELYGSKWVNTSLVRPEIGNVGVTSLVFGEYYRLREPFEFYTQTKAMPIEVALHDVLLPPGLITGAPVLDVYLGDDHPLSGAPDYVPLVGDYVITKLGKGADVLATPDWPRYADMARAVAGTMDLDLSEHEVWRVRIEFPVYQSTSRIKWTLKNAVTPPAE